MATYYEVLGVRRNASLDEVKAAYRRLAATCMPAEMKPTQQRNAAKSSGTRRRVDSFDEKRQAWLEIQRAFDVLANPKRRLPYDKGLEAAARKSGEGLSANSSCSTTSTSSRMQEERSSSSASDLSSSTAAESELQLADLTELPEEELFAVVSGVACQVAEAEPPRADATPLVLSGQQPWESVRQFYGYWCDWSSTRSFTSADRHTCDDIAAAASRQVRRLMESENDKLRRNARKDYSTRVRDFMRQAQAQDPRVKARRDAQRAEAHAAKALKREAREKQDNEIEEAREERRLAARAADEERWAEQAASGLQAGFGKPVPVQLRRISVPGSPEPFYCQACVRGFRTKDAWLAHAASKRHRQSARRWEEDGHEGDVLVASASLPGSPGASCSPSPLVFGQSSKSMSPVGRYARDPDQLFDGELMLCGYDDLDMLPEAAQPLDGQLDMSSGLLPFVGAGAAASSSARRPTAAAKSEEVDSTTVPLSAMAMVPGHAWASVLLFLGCDSKNKGCAATLRSAMLALLGSSVLRGGELGDPALWLRIAGCLWGDACTPCRSSCRGEERFLELAGSQEELEQLRRAFLAKDSDLSGAAEGGAEASRKSRYAVRRTSVEDAVCCIAATDSLIATSSPGASQARLFGHGLAKLAPVRLRGKAVEALALSSSSEHLAVGAADHVVSLYSTSEPEAQPVRLHRLVDELPGGVAGFAGMYFASPGRIVTAVHAGRSAVVLDVDERGSLAESSPTEGDGHLLKVAPLSHAQQPCVLLVDGKGRTKIWDLRSPATKLLCELNAALKGGVHFECAAVDSRRQTLAAASPEALLWTDLRAPRPVELPVPFQRYPTRHLAPALALSPGGCLVSWWAAEQEGFNACLFAGGHSLVPVDAGPARAMPLASCHVEGGESGSALIMGLASQRRRRLEFELCVVGVRGCLAPAPTFSIGCLGSSDGSGAKTAAPAACFQRLPRTSLQAAARPRGIHRGTVGGKRRGPR
eukprot:TRINITY_DN30399_c0_g1_i1.p1 TRINITY_DN30399_c0_g1~~TRINITY_DN30399_c0_g1_i1.p1  ORF type:complete len:986 (-),score=239.96 TRINITY_DN30399_c0_g1_i1:225-3182(-)